MPERFLVWGAGGHGRVVRDLLLACGDDVVGYLDAGAPPGGEGRAPDGLPMAPEAAAEGPTLPFGATAVALGVGDNAARHRVFERIVGRIRCPARIHPGAALGSHVRVGAGSVVFPGAVLNAGALVGAGVIINTRVVVEHDGRVGDGAHLSPGVVVCGGVRVGRLAWIGAGAIVIPGLSIGDGAVVGAGSVVLADVAAGDRVAGNPARSLRG